MLAVKDQERERAITLTNMSRTLTQSASSTVSGWVMQMFSLSAPVILAGGLKIFYDLFLYESVRKIKEGKKMIRLAIIFVTALTTSAVFTQAQESMPLKLIQTIPLPNVEGRIDHIEADVTGKHLFVAALGNNTVEIINFETGQRIKRLTNFEEPQGVLFVPEFNKLFVTNRGNGRCDIFEGSSLKHMGSVSFSSDADNIHYDDTKKIVYVGYGGGALGLIDAATGKQIGNITLEGHPESFEIERSGHRVFVNIPGGRVAVVDIEKQVVLTTWSADLFKKGNYPMALDETDHRLFVGYRWPSKIVIFDTESGKSVAELENVGDADDIFYDSGKKRIYVSGGAGALLVVQQTDAEHYKTLSKIVTVKGARTSLFVPELNRLYLAVPRQGNKPAEIRVYQTNP